MTATEGITLQTQRLLLRTWQPGDEIAARTWLCDPVVRRYFPETFDHAGSDAQVQACRKMAIEHGFSLQPLVLKATGEVIGHHGLHRFPDDLPFRTGCAGVEIGWTLARKHWGKGYATEMGQALVVHARDELKLPDLVSFTAWENLKSRAVMLRLGLLPWQQFDGEFDHPRLLPGHPLRRHHLLRVQLQKK